MATSGTRTRSARCDLEPVSATRWRAALIDRVVECVDIVPGLPARGGPEDRGPASAFSRVTFTLDDGERVAVGLRPAAIRRDVTPAVTNETDCRLRGFDQASRAVVIAGSNGDQAEVNELWALIGRRVRWVSIAGYRQLAGAYYASIWPYGERLEGAQLAVCPLPTPDWRVDEPQTVLDFLVSPNSAQGERQHEDVFDADADDLITRGPGHPPWGVPQLT